MSTPAATPQVNPEQAVAYAALILADDNIPITADKLQTLLKAANLDSHVEPIWTTLFAKALEGKSVKDLLTAIDSAAPAARAVPSGGSLEVADRNDDAEVKEKADDKADEDSDDGEGMMDLFG